MRWKTILTRTGLFLLVAMLAASATPLLAQTGCPVGEWRVNDACAAVAALPLHDGWNEILPGGATRCAHDTPFRFWIRPGGPDLLFFFQGGGGCWNAETCQVGSPLYKQVVAPGEAENYRSGIFDFDNPDNPFAAYTMVFVPSCTGDVYMGSAHHDYGDGVTLYHRGFENLLSAIEFTAATIPTPDSIFITGCSAGSVGSFIAAPQVIARYPGVRVAQMGDSLGAIFSQRDDADSIWGIAPALPDWIDTMPDPHAFRLTDYVIALAGFYPDVTFAQYNTQYDNVQQRYFAIGASDPRAIVSAKINTLVDEASSAAPNFRAFTEGGDVHCITPRAQFYSYALDGVRLRDWVADLADGRAVASLRCTDCDSPETVR
ncbi:MAG: hypothetical protein KC519_02290 [Anaerolineae bacterium]|nr:hypothetical protein [Anaerolineae bacterium]